MKSASECGRPAAKWRLRRTLKRKTSYRPIETEDVKYLWAAYKKGSLKDAIKAFQIPEDMSPEDFKTAFENVVLKHCHAVWTLFAQGKRPVGNIFCAWSPLGNHLEILGITWMPWATNRNMVETLTGFFNEMRKQFNFLGYALPEHKRMYEVGAMHGIARRVGTSYVIVPGKACAVFETRAP